MEASSHGIHQKRTTGLHFEGAIFTNLIVTTISIIIRPLLPIRMQKRHLFDHLPKSAFALVNTDDKNGLVMLQNTKAQKIYLCLKIYADYRVKILENQFSGFFLKLNEQEVWTRLIGDFNAYNILAIYAASICWAYLKKTVLVSSANWKVLVGDFNIRI